MAGKAKKLRPLFEMFLGFGWFLVKKTAANAAKAEKRAVAIMAGRNAVVMAAGDAGENARIAANPAPATAPADDAAEMIPKAWLRRWLLTTLTMSWDSAGCCGPTFPAPAPAPRPKVPIAAKAKRAVRSAESAYTNAARDAKAGSAIIKMRAGKRLAAKPTSVASPAAPTATAKKRSPSSKPEKPSATR